MMPIEEGCLAITCGSQARQNNGQTVTVGRCLGVEPTCGDALPIDGKYGAVWEINKPMIMFDLYGAVSIEYAYPEIYLMRIDGLPEEEKEREVEELLL